MNLRINNYKNKDFILINIKSAFTQDPFQRKSTILDESIEEIWCDKGVPVFKIVYSNESHNAFFRRKSNLYAFFEDGTLLSEPITDERVTDYLPNELRNYKIKLFKKVLTNISQKAQDEGVLSVLNSILNMPLIAEAINKVTVTSDTAPLVLAIEDASKIDANKNPLNADVPNWLPEDAAKFGTPVGYTPKIKEWLNLFFNPENFDSIYPKNIE